MIQRISAFLFGLTIIAVALAAPTSHADDRVWRTSTSLVGEPKYSDGFTHYDHVNPDAPKGGTYNSAAFGTFDSFNPFIVQGKPAAGLNYQGGLLYDLLMSKGIDAPSESHPLIAEAFTYPDDYSQTTYRLNPKARWHDGKPITAVDVKWSMEMLKEHSPQYDRYFADVKEVRIDSDTQVTFLFAQKNNRELPLIIGDLPVLPKHWWEATGANGKPRDFTKSSLEPPLGSGPYRIKEFKAGESIVWERVKDYWAANSPTRKGRYNFDLRKYTYFKDPNAIWEAFKKGGFEDVRLENRAEYWARRYSFPSFEAGDVKRKLFDQSSGYPMQGFYINARLPKFSDPRTRKALTFAMNFEQMNETLFFNQYTRTDSYFGGTELQSGEMPTGRELEILSEYKDQLPADLFAKPFELPIYQSRRDERKFLKVANDLLREAGWVRKGTSLVNAKTGEPFTLQILGASPNSEKINAPWLNSLRKLGIDATFRVVDTAQYVQRVTNFDYEVISIVTQQSHSPGNEQREYWTSSAADRSGSRNYSGIKDPVVDALVERIVYAKDREELVALSRALDRVLLFGYYAVPQWYLSKDRVAYWDKFGIPEPQPTYAGVDIESWWIIAEKEAALNAKY